MTLRTNTGLRFVDLKIRVNIPFIHLAISKKQRNFAQILKILKENPENVIYNQITNSKMGDFYEKHNHRQNRQSRNGGICG